MLRLGAARPSRRNHQRRSRECAPRRRTGLLRSPAMTRTTPPRPVDILELFPELAEHCATSTRLHPRPGVPTVSDSSVGGPLLWPADEAWPVCTDGDEHYVDQL